MQSNVTIQPDELGNVIRVSKNNPEYGHVRITQEAVAFTANGWVKKSTRSTLIHGTVEDLTEIGIANKKTLPGKIVIRESVDPFNTEDPDRDIKIAGDTGVVCCYHGQPIYRKAFYTLNEDDQDEFVAHTNSDAIKEAQQESANALEDVKAEAAPKKKSAKKKDDTKQEISAEDLAEIQANIAADNADVEEGEAVEVDEEGDETFSI